jgi:hypothetical protein
MKGKQLLSESTFRFVPVFKLEDPYQKELLDRWVKTQFRSERENIMKNLKEINSV